MAHVVLIVPITSGVGAKTVSSGLVDVLTNKGVRVAALPDFDSEKIEHLLCSKSPDEVFEDIYEQCKIAAFSADLVLVNCLSPSNTYAAEFNFSLATALDAAVIFVIAPMNDLDNSLRQLKIAAKPYQSRYQCKILGVVANKIDPTQEKLLKECLASPEINIPLLASIPYRNDLTEISSVFYASKSINKYFNLDWVWPFLNNIVEHAFTPTMFKYQLFSSAIRANRKIVLPEGDELRILQAANICANRGFARCILLGDRSTIQNVCIKNNIKLNNQIEIIEPKSVAEKYVAPLCEARRNKGMTAEEASKQLEDSTVLGTMMLHLGEVDGLVSGAVHTTANTIRPALQIVKTATNSKLVSSVFFMCLPNQVLVYGDCAINPNPNAEELADIAIQSAKSAEDFGIVPRIAMLSYSTGGSGVGADVDKVKAATALVKKLRPDLAIDGPLQYDAAIDDKVAMIKAPNSVVAGRATVFIVPDLDVGNVVYKAVQRSTGIVCVGPVLQGLRKPVNDLSRGCSVEDIVFTIAITAVQSSS